MEYQDLHTRNEATADFIRDNVDGDVRQLALKGTADKAVDLHYALEQIAGRQVARRKLPSWAAVDGLEYPPHLSLEQCSGEKAAQYKTDVARRLMRSAHSDACPSKKNGKEVSEKTRLTDLTGGFGVDFSFMARAFDEAVYVERQERLCDIALKNMPLLGLEKAEIVCGDAEEYLRAMPVVHALPNNADNSQLSPISSTFSIIFIDPARRDNAGERTYGIADCTPDVIALKDKLLDRADYVMIKLSPMLDWRKAVADLGESVGEVHIFSAGNECKDLLIVMSKRYNRLERLFCINDAERTIFDVDSAVSNGNYEIPKSRNSEIFNSAPTVSVSPGRFLFEPNASVMKAGLFDAVQHLFDVCQIERNSHLYVSEIDKPDFPGRRFRISAITTMNKKELKSALADITKANIAVRNFPLSVAELRKRLKISDGGETYIFATTLGGGTHVLLVCSKV